MDADLNSGAPEYTTSEGRQTITPKPVLTIGSGRTDKASFSTGLPTLDRSQAQANESLQAPDQDPSQAPPKTEADRPSILLRRPPTSSGGRELPINDTVVTLGEIEREARVPPIRQTGFEHLFRVMAMDFVESDGLDVLVFDKILDNRWRRQAAEVITPQIELWVNRINTATYDFANVRMTVATNTGQKVSWVSKAVNGFLSFFGIGKKDKGVADMSQAVVEWANDPKANGDLRTLQDALEVWRQKLLAVSAGLREWRKTYDIDSDKPQYGKMQRDLNLVVGQLSTVLGFSGLGSGNAYNQLRRRYMNYLSPEDRLTLSPARHSGSYSDRQTYLPNVGDIGERNTYNLINPVMTPRPDDPLLKSLANLRTILNQGSASTQGKIQALQITNMVYNAVLAWEKDLDLVSGDWKIPWVNSIGKSGRRYSVP